MSIYSAVLVAVVTYASGSGYYIFSCSPLNYFEVLHVVRLNGQVTDRYYSGDLIIFSVEDVLNTCVKN